MIDVAVKPTRKCEVVRRFGMTDSTLDLRIRTAMMTDQKDVMM